MVCVIACGLYWLGKGHTILLENKDVTINGTAYAAVDHILQVSVDGKKAIRVKSGSRKKLKGNVSGPWHSIKVESLDDNKQVVKTVEKKFSTSLDDMFLLSLPALLADDDNWAQVFTMPAKK
ncbi:hypothetical protein CSB45_10960 [candidate division KSB3 bacterium]|uniref:Uncharacterized protein n=1 Tax=candidate division KSB3 bacterium TaxID=2044937 RepID=A0A2G6E373_9BACT|nr:MAG: hypothetical protein CSB45_10960 [candidate division KSB3 bacterium]PIE29069.1 MAG: hypothetical protein CSA57_10645 [candidate division KSB3 bacterium]